MIPSHLQRIVYRLARGRYSIGAMSPDKFPGNQWATVSVPPDIENSVANDLDFRRTGRQSVVSMVGHKLTLSVRVRLPRERWPDEMYQHRLPCHKAVG